MTTSVAVYCSSSDAIPREYLELAARAGEAIAARGWRLVYGGGAVGMMGRCADAALATGGQVTGVITRHLLGYEVGHQGLTEFVVVETMHRRKELMSRLADAFLVLPGGFGTLEEAMECITWRQLGIEEKQIVILNAFGFFDRLLEFFAAASDLRFIRPEHLRIFDVCATVDQAMYELEHPQPRIPDPEKWWRETGGGDLSTAPR